MTTTAPPPMTAADAIRGINTLYQFTAHAPVPLPKHQQLQTLRDHLIAFISSTEKPTEPTTPMNAAPAG